MTEDKGITRKAALLSSAATLTAGLILGAIPLAMAQQQGNTPDQAEEEEIEQIVVTGSRIQRPELTSPSPLTVVGAEDFQVTGTINTEALLNQLPQVIPGVTQFSNNPGGGIATVNLRGLGSSRTLVLVNGRRLVPSTTGGSVDLNNIPAPLIKRVETITGGASAVYGSDAIAGVVNFILKDDFEGAEINAMYRVTSRGDSAIKTASLTVGGNFADGRGNIFGHIEYLDREETFAAQRKFTETDFRDGTCDPTTVDKFKFGESGSGPDAIPCFTAGGSSGIPEALIIDGDLASTSFGGALMTFLPDGTPVPFGTNGIGLYNFAPPNYLQVPQERFLIYTGGHYDLFDNVQLFFTGTFSHNRVPQQLAPTPFFSIINEPVDINVDNPLLSPQLQTIFSELDEIQESTLGLPKDGVVRIFDIRRRLLEVGPRFDDDVNNAFQIEFGARGEIDAHTRWEVYYQVGKVDNPEIFRNDASQDRLQRQLLAKRANDGSIQCAENVDADGNVISNPTDCVPINLFGRGNISQAAADFLRLNAQTKTEIKQEDFVAVVNGDLGQFFTLPGGDIGYAVGVEYRRVTGAFNADDPFERGTVTGFNAAQSLAGKFDVLEFFGEVNLPLLVDQPFAEYLGIDGAIRVSDYSQKGTGTVTTWALQGEWVPVGGLRFRGGFQRAVRAPSIVDLFLGQGNNFPGASDPCAGSTPVGNSELTQLCIANGVPSDRIGTVPEPAAGQVQEIVGGNPDLDAEKADTYTVGVQLTPDFLPGFAMSIDYYNINISNAISQFGGGAANIIQSCFFVAKDANSPFCQAIKRTATGAIQAVFATNANIAVIETSGVDVELDYEFAVADVLGDVIGSDDLGDFKFRFLGTFVDENRFQADPISPFQNCVGLFGDICGEPDPEFRWVADGRWSWRGLTTNIRVRWLDKVRNDLGVTFDGSNRTFDKDLKNQIASAVLKAQTYVDISASYQVMPNVLFTLGVDNVFDNHPPLTAQDEQSNTYPGTYTVLGTTFWGSLKLTF